MKTLFAAAFGFALLTSATADEKKGVWVSEPEGVHAVYDGNQLAKWARSLEATGADFTKGTDSERLEAAMFAGYVIGVFDTLNGKAICPGQPIPPRQVLAIVSKYVRENPDKWQGPAWWLVLFAVQPAFPCDAAER